MTNLVTIKCDVFNIFGGPIKRAKLEFTGYFRKTEDGVLLDTKSEILFNGKISINVKLYPGPAKVKFLADGFEAKTYEFIVPNTDQNLSDLIIIEPEDFEGNPFVNTWIGDSGFISGERAAELITPYLDIEESEPEQWPVQGTPSTFPPSPHGHIVSDITNLSQTLDGKANVNHVHTWESISNKPNSYTPSVHGHTIFDITDLSATLNNKSNTDHAHTWGEVQGKPTQFVPEAHNHEISNINNLSSSLNLKSNVGHTHNWLDIQNKPTTFAPSQHIHAISDINNLENTLAQKADLVDGYVATSQIPAVGLTTSKRVANEAAMLALDFQEGDIAIRLDGAGSFILGPGNPTQLSSWALLNAPTDSVSSVNGQIGLVVLGKSDIGLNNVDNTSDNNKPVSALQQTALNTKENVIVAGTTGQYYRGDKTWQTLNKNAVGLSSVDNTSDVNKPVSTAQQTAINAKENTIIAGTTSQFWRGDKSWQNLNKTAVGLSNVDNTSDMSKPISTSQSLENTAIRALVDNKAGLDDPRFTDARSPKIVDKGTWQPNTAYNIGDVVYFVGRKWARAQAGTSGSTFNEINWIMLGKVDDNYTMLNPGSYNPPPHFKGSSTGTQIVSQNSARAVRFGIGRTCTLTGISVEVTALGSNPSATYLIKKFNYDRATGTIDSAGSHVTLGTILLDSVGLKTLTLNESVQAGTDVVFSLVSQSSGPPTVRTFVTTDPLLFDSPNTALVGMTGWNGTNSATTPFSGATPAVYLTAS